MKRFQSQAIVNNRKRAEWRRWGVLASRRGRIGFRPMTEQARLLLLQRAALSGSPDR